jgi:glycosyltransferase A (GT-A) superfamily protein (DUF2064 family)
VVVGTDVPDLSRADIGGALARLRDGRMVIGPAADGGFWLLAVAPRQAVSLRFDNVRWSSPHTLDDVIKRTGRPTTLLQTLVDIDDGHDLRAWRARQAKRHVGRGTRTADPADNAPAEVTSPAARTN